MFKRLMQTINGATASGLEVTVAEAAAAHTEGTAQFVDVREVDEWVTGHIPGALHIPLGDIGRRGSEVDSGRPVIAVCRSGRRSLTAAEALRAAGHRDAVSLAGGMIAWEQAHHPIKS
jgi:rhodanese-related sulfurtransferase